MTTRNSRSRAAQSLPAVAAVPLQPGDTLVVATPSGGSHAQVETLRARLEEALPGITIIVVTNVSGLAAYNAGLPELVGTAGKDNGKDEQAPADTDHAVSKDAAGAVEAVGDG